VTIFEFEITVATSNSSKGMLFSSEAEQTDINTYNGLMAATHTKHLSSKAHSGVFRISVRRGRCAVGVKGSGVWWRGLGTSPEKKTFLSPK